MRASKLFLASAGFFADSYDLFVINMVTKIMGELYTQTSWDTSLISTIALVGAMFGQIGFGWFADCIGRKAIFVTTATFVTIGAMGSALFTTPSWNYIYIQLAIWRCLLGIAIGGEYPLSACVSKESTSHNSETAMMLVFSMQGLGSLCASLVVFVLLSTDIELEWAWRLSLLFGSLPTLFALYPRFKMEETDEYKMASDNGSSQHQMSLMEAAYPSAKLNQWSLLKQKNKQGKTNLFYLFGTAMNWFLFDVAFYANSLFSATITQAMGFPSSTLLDQCKNTIYIALLALPGYFLAILLLPKMGLKTVQFSGFVCCAMLFAILGIFLDSLKSVPFLMFLLYGATFLFSNFGPNTTTFIAPVRIFPVLARATSHGISAATGKLGAIVGVVFLKPLLDTQGLELILIICAFVSVLGAITTAIFTPSCD